MGHGSAGEEPILDFDDAISGPHESTVMGDDEERAVAAPLLLADEREDPVAPFSVEVASRLVGERRTTGSLIRARAIATRCC